MPKKSKTLLDHANDLATDIVDKIGPQVEHAVETAKEKAGPVIAEARDKAAPAVSDARDRINTEVIPAIAAAIAAANEATEEVRGEAGKRSKAAVAALKGEVEAPTKKTHRFRNFLVVLGLGGLVAFVAKKLSDRPSTTTWESNYTPAPAPTTPTSAAGAHRAEGEGDDQGGSSPDVAKADAAAEPHEATTPDNPAETIDVKNS
jgi:vacuolar-type H+-ATPase subunit H